MQGGEKFEVHGSEDTRSDADWSGAAITESELDIDLAEVAIWLKSSTELVEPGSFQLGECRRGVEEATRATEGDRSGKWSVESPGDI